MDPFDHLERELRGGVRRRHGAARRRSWRAPVLGFVAALVVTGGALAATGTIPIGPVHESNDPLSKPRADRGAGVRAGPANTLALRVADPAGGPPWTLRVFEASRGAGCVQVGQVVRGHFGVFVAPGVLEPLHAWPGGDSSLCSGQIRNDFPVVRGLQRIRAVGGNGDPHRCPGEPNGDCPISSVTLLRYGLLGPGARRVRLLDAKGHTLASARTSPRLGGAYLFAVALPTAPYVAANHAQRGLDAELARRGKAAERRGVSKQQALRAAIDELTTGRYMRRTNVRPPVVHVVATFAGGRTLRVAGPGRSHADLPGLGAPPKHAAQAPLPRDVPVRTRIAPKGRFATVTVSFRAPRAIDRFGAFYKLKLHGPTGTRCDHEAGGYDATTGNVTAGDTVRFTLRRPRSGSEDGRSGWCRAPFTVDVLYSTPGKDTKIGHAGFHIRY
jgi:hypothetical protein